MIVEEAFDEPARAHELVVVRDGSRWLIEPAQTADGIPQQAQLPVGRRRGEHTLSPARARRRDDRPVCLVPRNAFAERPHAARNHLLHRTDELGCRVPEFHELPRERATFRVFALVGDDAR